LSNLCIDIGNTFTKIAVFDHARLIHFDRLKEMSLTDLQTVVDKFKVKKSIISSVKEEVEVLEDFLGERTNYVRFSTSLTNGVRNNYQSPSTLGLDRWAAVLGAFGQYARTKCLVIDAGTCITYDVIDSEQTYYGGSISPGISMRFKAVHQFTGRLPLIEWRPDENIPAGTDTQTAIKNGVLQGVINEIEGFIALNNKDKSAFKVIITGGDADFLFNQLQNSIFAPQIIKDPYLVLKGLNEAIAD